MKKIKRLDDRGFVLVETIIVAVFIIGICTFVFANFLPLMADYERTNNYDQVESKYKVNEIRKMLLREIFKDNTKRGLLTEVTNYTRYQNYEDNTTGQTVTKNSLCKELDDENYCNALLGSSFLDVKEIIITKFKLSSLKTDVKDNKNFDRSLREYIDYLPKYDKYSNKYNSYNRIIVMFNNGEFANIEVRYEIG